MHIHSRTGAKSRAFWDEPIEIANLVRCGVKFWQCSADFHFTRQRPAPIVAVKNPSNPKQAATFFKAL
jgi:hypothetical protein